ncbi:Condensation domain protein [Candidatus Magnetomorum sp. HK-1]|nr:Condensation domain protein [Candidatus Magnetomorum sp. HK-1]
MTKNENFVKLNRSDFLFFAMDSIITSLTQLITLRFKEKHDVDEIKLALRYLMTLYPRFRSVVQPTLFSYGIKVIDQDDRKVDILFQEAFKVKRNISLSSDQYDNLRRDMLNEPFSLEMSFPIRFCYLPDDPKPVLLISLHHIAGDGMSWFHFTNALLAHLNGKKISEVPLDNSGVTPALIDDPFYKIPFQFLKSLKRFVTDIGRSKGEKIIRPSIQPADFYGPVNSYYHVINYDIPTILSISRTLGCSITVLFMASLARAIIKKSGNKKGNVIGMLVSFDLRPYFKKNKPVLGNFVRAFMIKIHEKYFNDPMQIIEQINTQLKEFQKQLNNREILFPWMLDCLYMLMGKKLYSRAISRARKKGLYPITCQVSNLGNLDPLNTNGENAQLCEAIATVPVYGIFMTITGLDGKFVSNFSYPEAEFTKDEIVDYVKCFENELGNYVIASSS